jgi:hypothetical protein
VLLGAFFGIAAKLQSEEGEQMLAFWQRGGKPAFEQTE